MYKNTILTTFKCDFRFLGGFMTELLKECNHTENELLVGTCSVMCVEYERN